MSDQTLLEKTTAEIDTLLATGGDNSDGGDGSDSDPTADNLSNNELVLRIRHMIDTCQHPRKKVKKIAHKLRPKKLLTPRNTSRSAAPIPARTHLTSRSRSVSIHSFDSHNSSSSLHCQTSFFHTSHLTYCLNQSVTQLCLSAGATQDSQATLLTLQKPRSLPKGQGCADPFST